MNSAIEEIRRLAKPNLDAQQIPRESFELRKLEFGRHAIAFATRSDLSMLDHAEITKQMTTPQADDYWLEYFTSLHELDDERLGQLRNLAEYIPDKTIDTFEINGEVITSGERRRTRALAITISIRDSCQVDSRIHSLAVGIIEFDYTENEITTAARYEIGKLRDIRRKPNESIAELIPEGVSLRTVYTDLL
jgi:hypothetical protein